MFDSARYGYTGNYGGKVYKAIGSGFGLRVYDNGSITVNYSFYPEEFPADVPFMIDGPWVLVKADSEIRYLIDLVRELLL